MLTIGQKVRWIRSTLDDMPPNREMYTIVDVGSERRIDRNGDLAFIVLAKHDNQQVTTQFLSNELEPYCLIKRNLPEWF